VGVVLAALEEGVNNGVLGSVTDGHSSFLGVSRVADSDDGSGTGFSDAVFPIVSVLINAGLS